MAETAGAGARERVPMKVLSRSGPICLVENPAGERYWLVVCPHCSGDLSRVSFGRLVATPQGFIPDVYYPTRCPECGAGLLPVPSILAVPPGTKLGPT